MVVDPAQSGKRDWFRESLSARHYSPKAPACQYGDTNLERRDRKLWGTRGLRQILPDGIYPVILRWRENDVGQQGYVGGGGGRGAGGGAGGGHADHCLNPITIPCCSVTLT